MIFDLIDLFAEFPDIWNVLRAIWPGYMRLRTRGWPMAAVTVNHKRIRKDGCWTVELSYWYTTSGERYGGIYERRFHGQSAAQQYLDLFESNVPFLTRYYPRNPERSWGLYLEDER